MNLSNNMNILSQIMKSLYPVKSHQSLYQNKEMPTEIYKKLFYESIQKNIYLKSEHTKHKRFESNLLGYLLTRRSLGYGASR